MVHAFPASPLLARLTKSQFDLVLATVVGPGSGTQNEIFELINYMEAQGRLDELLVGIRAENPGNPKILEFLREIGFTSDEAVQRPVLESVIGANTQFLDVASWRTKLDRLEYQVGRVEKAGRHRGTAFLVGPDLVLTNYHVIRAVTTGGPNGWGVRFDYKTAEGGVAVSAGTLVPFHQQWRVDLAPPSPLDTKATEDRNGQEPKDEELDFALVRLAKPIGSDSLRGNSQETRGWIKLPTEALDWNDVRSIGILQHPQGQPLKLSLQTPAQLTANPTNNRVRYTAPTKDGSSGSPVFDGDWNLIALHHSGDPSEDVKYNEAIPIHLVAARPAVKAAVPQPPQ